MLLLKVNCSFSSEHFINENKQEDTTRLITYEREKQAGSQENRMESGEKCLPEKMTLGSAGAFSGHEQCGGLCLLDCPVLVIFTALGFINTGE